MAKKKDDKIEELEADVKPLMTNGTHWNIIQLPMDFLPLPAAQRITQLVNKDGTLIEYVSENAYARTECIEIFRNITKNAYDQSIGRGAATLLPYKGKYHWCIFTEDFAKTGKGPRINPETGMPEL